MFTRSEAEIMLIQEKAFKKVEDRYEKLLNEARILEERTYQLRLQLSKMSEKDRKASLNKRDQRYFFLAGKMLKFKPEDKKVVENLSKIVSKIRESLPENARAQDIAKANAVIKKYQLALDTFKTNLAHNQKLVESTLHRADENRSWPTPVVPPAKIDIKRSVRAKDDFVKPMILSKPKQQKTLPAPKLTEDEKIKMLSDIKSKFQQKLEKYLKQYENSQGKLNAKQTIASNILSSLPKFSLDIMDTPLGPAGGIDTWIKAVQTEIASLKKIKSDQKATGYTAWFKVSAKELFGIGGTLVNMLQELKKELEVLKDEPTPSSLNSRSEKVRSRFEPDDEPPHKPRRPSLRM